MWVGLGLAWHLTGLPCWSSLLLLRVVHLEELGIAPAASWHAYTGVMPNPVLGGRGWQDLLGKTVHAQLPGSLEF